MLSEIVFEYFIKSEPVPKGRPRAYKNQLVTPKKTRLYENTVRMESKIAMLKNSLVEPFSLKYNIQVQLIFCLSIPKSRKDLSHGDWMNKKPDLDNLIKSILDGMQDVVFEDDKQIVAIDSRKIYVESHPGTKVFVSAYPIERLK